MKAQELIQKGIEQDDGSIVSAIWREQNKFRATLFRLQSWCWFKRAEMEWCGDQLIISVPERR